MPFCKGTFGLTEYVCQSRIGSDDVVRLEEDGRIPCPGLNVNESPKIPVNAEVRRDFHGPTTSYRGGGPLD